MPATVECDGDSASSATGVATATDTCDTAPVVTQSDAIAAGSCPQESVITRTWTATDASGNSATCDQTVTVVDTTLPAALCQDLTITLNAGSQQTVTADEMNNGSNDLCGIATLELSQTLFDCTHRGDTTVTLTVTDNNGNASTCTATVTVTVEDTTPPTITCPRDTIRTANSSCGWVPEDGGGASRLGTPTANGNCPDGLVVINDALTSFPLGSTTVKWTAADAAGNSASCEQIVLVRDETAPDMVCPADLTDIPNTEEISNLGSVTVIDNCPVPIAVGNNAPVSFPVGTTEVI